MKCQAAKAYRATATAAPARKGGATSAGGASAVNGGSRSSDATPHMASTTTRNVGGKDRAISDSTDVVGKRKEVPRSRTAAYRRKIRACRQGGVLGLRIREPGRGD